MSFASQVSALLCASPEIVSGIDAGGRNWIRSHKAKIRAEARSAGVALEIERAIRSDLGTGPPSGIVYAGQAALETYPESFGCFSGRCVAVTSLNPNPAKLQRQFHCLQSWQRYGLEVITVNTSAELAELELPEGVNGVACEDLTTLYEKPTQRITNLLRVAAETRQQTLLINSDIEIHGDPQILDRALEQPERLTIGVRWNHEPTRAKHTAIREQWGLDAFCISPEMAVSIPDAPFGIGKPVWDYWLPACARKQGVRFHWINEPLFYHESHALAWSQAEWQLGADVLMEQCDNCLQYGSADFRLSLNLNI